MINVSSQMLKQQTGPALDKILIGDISRQLASYLDQVALYGVGPSGNQPLGLTGVAGVAQGVPIDSADLHGSSCALEAQIEAANVDMTNYGVLVSPASEKTLRTTPSFTGGSITTWAELRGAQSSPEITDNRCFAGCWHCMTFCLWCRGIEVLVDPFTLSQSNQVRLMSAILRCWRPLSRRILRYCGGYVSATFFLVQPGLLNGVIGHRPRGTTATLRAINFSHCRFAFPMDFEPLVALRGCVRLAPW